MTVTQIERAPRCLKLTVGKRGKNQCESEQVDGSDLCAHHLAMAAEDYRRITEEYYERTHGKKAAP